MLGNYTRTVIDPITGVVTVYRDTPFFLNIWFGIAVLLVIACLIILGFYLFRIYLKNRTLFIIHMPNRTRQVFAYKKFEGTEIKIPTGEKAQDGTAIRHSYIFRPECVEDGFWGKYIEYDFKVSEPLNPSTRQSLKSELQIFYKFISSLLDTDLAVDLLLANKFKDFVKTMLVIILIAMILFGLASVIIPFAYHPVETCKLSADNVTMAVIRASMVGS